MSNLNATIACDFFLSALRWWYATLPEFMESKYGHADVRTEFRVESTVVEYWRIRQSLEHEVRCLGKADFHFGRLGNCPSAFSYDTLGPHTSCFFLLPHCGLPDGLYYLCLTDSLIRRDQRHAFDNGRGRDQPVCRVLWKASR